MCIRDRSKALVPAIALGFAVLTAALTAIALLVGHIMRGRSAAKTA